MTEKEAGKMAAKHGQVVERRLQALEVFGGWDEQEILAVYSRAKLAAHYGREALGE